jgi:hypothetical protein
MTSIVQLMTKHGIVAVNPQAITAFLQDVRAHDLMPEYTVDELADEMANDALADILGYASCGENLNERGRMLMSAVIERLQQAEASLDIRSVKI